MASSARPKPTPLTHFLCLPLVSQSSRPQLSASVAEFKADVIRSKDLGGFALPPDAIRPVGSLHLTLGVMSFPEDEGLDKAVHTLKSLKPRELLAGETTPEAAAAPREKGHLSELILSLTGLNSMQQPSRATVLYAPPSDPDGKLYRFAESIKAAFTDAHLLVPDKRPLLLHATIVNTSHVKRDKRKARNRKRISIQDAQALLDRYESQVWAAAVTLDKIAICKMSAKPVEENGVVVDAQYEVVAELEF